MKEEIRLSNEVVEIVQKSLERMFQEIWDSLSAENKTKDYGYWLTHAEEDMTECILKELTFLEIIK